MVACFKTNVDIKKYIFNKTIRLKVIPSSRQNKLIVENNQLKLYLKVAPEKNKANLGLIKFFQKEFHLQVEIKSGLKSRNKLVKILEP